MKCEPSAFQVHYICIKNPNYCLFLYHRIWGSVIFFNSFLCPSLKKPKSLPLLMKTNHKRCERQLICVSQTQPCVSVAPFAHMHCWCEASELYESVSRIACSLWINTSHSRKGLNGRHTWCPSGPSHHSWAELQRCSLNYAVLGINLALLVKLVSYLEKVISSDYHQMGTGCSKTYRFLILTTTLINEFIHFSQRKIKHFFYNST